ncbi:MAG: SUMF1/EgtB/PvdO family nonheme iron enzyme [Planctomycetota bacterium]
MPGDSPPSELPDPLERELERVLFSPGGGSAEQIEALCRNHAGQAERIRELANAQQQVAERLRQAEQRTGLAESIGPYRILETLGEGGMGTVYLAEQRTPVVRRVALKVIKLGMDTKQVLARFEAERQALALMEHDNIAKVLDAGATDQGRAYFVMEYIGGVPITQYAGERRLPIRQRLELVQQVCAGVQHAHQKGVIHRDLKPGNILVTLQGERPVAKIIDFGLARATDHRLVEATLFTREDLVIGTPAYMSPEQARIGRIDIDTRTDIYSLGVLLYELLTGGPPFPSVELRAAGILEMQRVIREEDPPRPSSRIARSEDLDHAAQFGTDLRVLRRSLRGDLDWITMKALEKDRARRYETAGALSEDIKRHLRHVPVEAGPPSPAYRLRKFLRRHRGQVIAGSLVLLTLVAGVIGTTLFAVRASRNAEAARTNEAAAKASEQQAVRNLTRFNLLRYRIDLDDALARAKTLFPAWPENIGKLGDWLDRSKPLLEEAPLAVRRAEARLREEAGTLAAKRAERGRVLEALARVDPAAADAAVRREELGERSLALGSEIGELEPRVSEPARRFLLQTLGKLDAELACFADPKAGTYADVRARLAWAEEIESRSVDRHREAWDESRRILEQPDGVSASQRYEEYPIDLAPQIGLVPLGIDPGSKLLEFGHPASGEIPARDPLSGKLQMDTKSSLVFILVPGGRSRLGSEPNDLVKPEETPAHELLLEPFFLSKYEMTHAQWDRLAGHWRIDASHDATQLAEKAGFEVKPIIRVSWNDCSTLCQAWGLELPTEAQWEHACRAGSSTQWSTGDTPDTLEGYANVGDQSGRRAFRIRGRRAARFDDGHVGRAPAFEFRPNAFGLHGMHGNAAEWCRDRPVRYQAPFSTRLDGLRVGPPLWEGDRRVVRGGSYMHGPLQTRSAKRDHAAATFEGMLIGLRPARRLFRTQATEYRRKK